LPFGTSPPSPHIAQHLPLRHTRAAEMVRHHTGGRAPRRRAHSKLARCSPRNGAEDGGEAIQAC
jgi:hypothetical protein